MQRKRRTMPGPLWVLALGLLLPLGCGQPPMADSAKARSALSFALESWKNGDSPDKLHSMKNPIFCNDDDWSAGMKLRSYKMADNDDYFGRSCRITVQLELTNKENAPMQKKINYVIDTGAAVVIVRER